MSKLVWDAVGERLYETGVSNGVLYPRDTNGLYPLGVAWNGLVGVTESPSGAEPNPKYADNIKYLNMISSEEFNGNIEAYTYPDEFEECNGGKAIQPGVTIGQQNRKTFGLAYKTGLGNDTSDLSYGYKLHLIYGAIAAPSEKAYQTINESPDAITFSWEISTTPVVVTGEKPTASLVIDSTKVDADKLAALELLLFGNTGTDPRLPLPDEIAALFAAAAPAAVALSTIDPADAATAVVVSKAITITFNNKIIEEDITVMTAAGVLVAMTKAWDANKKVLTMTHANFTAATLHLVTVAGVVDEYNQVLAPVVKKFTTA